MRAPVAWFGITSREPARLVDFYRELFGWTINEGPDASSSLMETGTGPDAIGGGIGATQGPDDPGGVTVYMRVDDLQASLDEAESLGGTQLVQPTDLPDGFGRFAMFSDPDGHTIGLWP